MQLPSGVKAYFEADKGDDADAVTQVFSSAAVVEDEGARYQGELLFTVNNGQIVALRIG